MRTVLALYAGGAGTLDTPSGPITTAIAKRPVAGRVRVEALGLPGDVQVHPTHGGPDRALCLYPHEHYARWDARVSPALGENLTSLGVLETLDMRISPLPSSYSTRSVNVPPVSTPALMLIRTPLDRDVG